LRFESAPALTDSTPDTFVAFAGTVVSGINPNTAITQATSQFSGYYPWIRINATSVTGSGVIRGLFYGYRISNTASVTATISGAIAPTSASSALGDAVTNTQTTITNAASTVLYNRVMQHVFNGATWDRARGDTSGAYVQGNAVAGAGIVASRPVIIGGVDNGGLAQYFATTVTGKIITAAPLTGVDTLSNAALSQVVNTSASGSGPLSTAPSVFNGATWDRVRGNTSGGFIQGPIADGVATAGNPVQIGGVDSSGVVQSALVDSTGGVTQASASSAQADAISNTQSTPANNVTPFYYRNTPLLFNSSTYDRQRSADLGNYFTAVTLTANASIGAAIGEKGGRFSVVSTPAAGTMASASIAADATPMRHVGDCISFSATSSGAAVATALTVDLRNGATGAGTIIWQFAIASKVAAAAGTQVVDPFTVCGLMLTTGGNTALTAEFSAGVANTVQSISLSGINLQ
jgi:hypothetical protein